MAPKRLKMAPMTATMGPRRLNMTPTMPQNSPQRQSSLTSYYSRIMPQTRRGGGAMGVALLNQNLVACLSPKPSKRWKIMPTHSMICTKRIAEQPGYHEPTAMSKPAFDPACSTKTLQLPYGCVGACSKTNEFTCEMRPAHAKLATKCPF